MPLEEKESVRASFLPFTRPSVGQEEIDEIIDSIESGWITTGPKVEKFSADLSRYIGAPYVAPVSSATAGLHVSLLAHGIGPGDEVITTPLTFAATANVIVLAGATPVFADIDRNTLQIRPEEVERKITPRTRAILPVHFAGQPADLDPLMELARSRNLTILEDAAHAIGTEYKGKRIGSHGNTSVFSFHPNKNMTTGEGGAVATFDEKVYRQVCLLSFHGMDKNAWKRFDKSGSARYDITEAGYKYNMMDIQAAMGIHQLKKLDGFIESRSRRANAYQEFFRGLDGIVTPGSVPYPHRHAWHLYTPLIDIDVVSIDRDRFMQELKTRNIGSGLHYTSVPEFSYYVDKYGFRPDEFPDAHYVSDRIVSLPLFPTMSDQDQEDVVEAVVAICARNKR